MNNPLACCGHPAERHLWSGGCNDCQCPRSRPGVPPRAAESTPVAVKREALDEERLTSVMAGLSGTVRRAWLDEQTEVAAHAIAVGYRRLSPDDLMTLQQAVEWLRLVQKDERREAEATREAIRIVLREYVAHDHRYAHWPLDGCTEAERERA